MALFSHRHIGVVFIVACVLFLVASAASAQGAHSPAWPGAKATPAHIQPVADATAQFLTKRGFAPKVAPNVVSVEAWAFRSTMGAQMRDTQAAVLLHSGWMSVDYRIAHQLRHLRRAHMGHAGPLPASAARTIIHEVLHLSAPDAPEGLIDAVALDLTAAFIDHYTGRAVRVDREALVADGYAGDVWDIWIEQRERLHTSHLSKRARVERERTLRSYM